MATKFAPVSELLSIRIRYIMELLWVFSAVVWLGPAAENRQWYARRPWLSVERMLACQNRPSHHPVMRPAVMSIRIPSNAGATLAGVHWSVAS